MFWGLVLEPSKKYTQKVDQTFHISQAALDLTSCDINEFVQLVVEYENSSFVLATLNRKANIFQVPLDLIFKTGDQISFRTIGNGKVHLSGYHVLDDLDSMIMNGEEESDLDEVQEPFPIEKGKGKRKKLSLNMRGGKKAKLENSNEDGTDDDEEEDDEDEDDDEDEEESEDDEEKTIGKKNKKKKPNTSFKSNLAIARMVDDDDDDDDEDDEEDDDFDEEEFQNEDEDIEMDEEDDENLDIYESDEEEENDQKKKVKSPKSEGKKSPQTPNGVASGFKGKDKSAQKGNKSMQQETPAKEKKTPKKEGKQKNEKNVRPGSAESTPKSKKEDKTKKSPKSDTPIQKKLLEGGVLSEELRVGNGPVAKPGKMVSVYYVGTLSSNKKEFDSVQSGPGFKFRVGRNEVIKGWDIGVTGMKVGGKRRITVPPHLAYGAKGSQPEIPPNSTLVFTIELKGVS